MFNLSVHTVLNPVNVIQFDLCTATQFYYSLVVMSVSKLSAPLSCSDWLLMIDSRLLLKLKISVKCESLCMIVKQSVMIRGSLTPTKYIGIDVDHTVYVVDMIYNNIMDDWESWGGVGSFIPMTSIPLIF